MKKTLEEASLRMKAVDQGSRLTLSDQRVALSALASSCYLAPGPAEWWEKASVHLDELLSLPRNWDSYNADAIGPEVVDSARGLLLALSQRVDLRQPLISPTRSGGVLLEWSSGSRELEIEVVSRDAASFLYADDRTSEEIEGELFRDEDLTSTGVLELLERLSQ